MVYNNKIRNIVMNTSAFKTILREHRTNTMSQGYLIVSNDAVVRNVFLDLFLQILYCKDEEIPCGICYECEKISNSNNVDVMYFGGENSFNKDDSVAFINETIIKPFEHDMKVLVIKNGDNMNDSSQNKLLKPLEELPKSCKAIILCSNSVKILPTIQSRLRKINIQNCSDEELIEYLKDSPNAYKIAMCSNGLLGEAERWKNNKNFDKYYDFALMLLNEFMSSKQLADVNYFFLKHKTEVKDIINIIESVFYRAIKKDIETDINVYALSECIKECNKSIKALESSVVQNAVIDTLLLKILEEKNKWK